MNINKALFLAGIEKKAEELSLPIYLKDHLLKKANFMFPEHHDNVEDVINKAGPGTGSEIMELLKHMGKHSLPAAGIGAGVGALSGHFIGKDKKSIGHGALLGGALGAVGGAAHDAYSLGDNERNDFISGIKDSMKGHNIPEGEDMINKAKDTPWYKFYLGDESGLPISQYTGKK